ncbi:MAG TPA: hypothetical protein VNH11_18330 [Pirellulales bacterium]|nr:hypothetical protein [Pirellulales bacterium]
MPNTYLHTAILSSFVDGPNIDGVLGEILGHMPESEERPRWDRVKRFLPSTGKPVFAMNGEHFTEKAYSFFRAMTYMGYDFKAVPPTERSSTNEDPVDNYIKDRLDAALTEQVAGRPQHITLLSHDHFHAVTLAQIVDAGGSIALIGFPEWLAPDLLALEGDRCEVLDLERDVGAFSYRLPRPYLPRGGRRAV